MLKEESFFISVISDFLSMRRTEPPDNISWSRLRILADQQQLSPVFYVQCRNKDFEQSYLAAQFYYLKRLEILRQLEKTFQENQIDFFIVKGPVVARCYPLPALRTMGDVDVVVHPEDREKASELMIKIGFLMESWGKTEWRFQYQKMGFELHDRLVYDQALSEAKYRVFFNNCWDYVKNNEVEPNFHFLFIIWHLRKHFKGSGVGLRQFMDVAVLEQQNLEWLWIEERLRELDMWSFSEKVFGLNRYWFGIVPPIRIDPVDKVFCEEASNLILCNGVFGFDNRANEHNVAVNTLREEGLGILTRLRLLFEPIFYSYSNMMGMPQYQYLKGKKYLLPVAWGHRAIRALRFGRARSTMRRLLGDAFASRREVDKRIKILDKWGIT